MYWARGLIPSFCRTCLISRKARFVSDARVHVIVADLMGTFAYTLNSGRRCESRGRCMGQREALRCQLLALNASRLCVLTTRSTCNIRSLSIHRSLVALDLDCHNCKRLQCKKYLKLQLVSIVLSIIVESSSTYTTCTTTITSSPLARSISNRTMSSSDPMSSADCSRLSKSA